MGNISGHPRSFEWPYLCADTAIGDLFMDTIDLAAPNHTFKYEELVSTLQYKWIVPFKSDARFDSLVVAARDALHEQEEARKLMMPIIDNVLIVEALRA